MIPVSYVLPKDVFAQGTPIVVAVNTDSDAPATYVSLRNEKFKEYELTRLRTTDLRLSTHVADTRDMAPGPYELSVHVGDLADEMTSLVWILSRDQYLALIEEQSEPVSVDEETTDYVDAWPIAEQTITKSLLRLLPVVDLTLLGDFSPEGAFKLRMSLTRSVEMTAKSLLRRRRLSSSLFQWLLTIMAEQFVFFAMLGLEAAQWRADQRTNRLELSAAARLSATPPDTMLAYLGDAGANDFLMANKLTGHSYRGRCEYSEGRLWLHASFELQGSRRIMIR